MSQLKKNIIANFAGTIWAALMSLAFIPIYIKFLGIESYGLIGIFATLQALITLFDMGLSATLTREMARLSVLPDSDQEMCNLVRSIEIIYWGVGLFIGITIFLIAPFIAHYWIKGGSVSSTTIEQAIRIMGFIIAFQWPASLYSGGLVGLQTQVLLNAINMAMSTLRGAGAVMILWLISPTIQSFFIWQIIISIINTFVLSYFLWHKLPRTVKKATFQKNLITGVWRFAVGMSLTSILGIILTQLDKIILSKMLSLEMFGYYMLAGTVAISLKTLLNPIISGIYPRLIQLVSLKDHSKLKQFYHMSCQFLAVAILPAAVVIALFSHEILLLWTQNTVTAEKTHLLLSILICGTALNGLMQGPGILYQAFGRTRLSVYVNAISVILIVPLIIIMTTHYGALGGASAWVILNVGYVFIAAQFIFKSTLPTEKKRWYWQDVSLPLFTSLVIAGLGRLLIGGQTSQFMTILYLSIVSLSTLAITSLITPATRTLVSNKLLNLKMK